MIAGVLNLPLDLFVRYGGGDVKGAIRQGLLEEMINTLPFLMYI